jgi:hypothetical protein
LSGVDLSRINPNPKWKVSCEVCGWRGVIAIPLGEAEDWIKRQVVCPGGTHILECSGKGLSIAIKF